MFTTATNMMYQVKDLPGTTHKRSDWALFNFVLDCSDAALEKYLSIGPDEWVKVFTRGDLNWCLQTYLILSERENLSVQCSNHLQRGCINIVHSDQLLKVKGDAQQFVVCVRADYPQRRWAHFHLVQNGSQRTANCAYIPHWVQPGLLGRNPERNHVSTVAYAGAPIRGNMAGDLAYWQQLFEPHGIEFMLLPSGNWHDLRNVDVLMAIRSFDTQRYHTKPPTKLFNAWQANIPLVGGFDSAFSEVGKPGQDYLRVRSPQEALAAVLRLRDDPVLYDTMVRRGAQRAQAYTREKIAEVWEKVLCGPVLQRYLAWKRLAVYEKMRFDFLQELGLMEHKGKQLVKRVLQGSKSLPVLRKTFS